MFLVLFKEVRTWDETKISSFCFWCYQVNGGSMGKLKLFLMLKWKQINQSINQITMVRKIRKTVNNIIVGLPCFTQTFHYHVFFILSCHFHMPHGYIFFLEEQSTWSGDTFPDMVFRVLLFCPIKWFRKNSLPVLEIVESWLV